MVLCRELGLEYSCTRAIYEVSMLLLILLIFFLVYLLEFVPPRLQLTHILLELHLVLFFLGKCHSIFQFMYYHVFLAFQLCSL